MRKTKSLNIIFETFYGQKLPLNADVIPSFLSVVIVVEMMLVIHGYVARGVILIEQDAKIMDVANSMHTGVTYECLPMETKPSSN